MAASIARLSQVSRPEVIKSGQVGGQGVIVGRCHALEDQLGRLVLHLLRALEVFLLLVAARSGDAGLEFSPMVGTPRSKARRPAATNRSMPPGQKPAQLFVVGLQEEALRSASAPSAAGRDWSWPRCAPADCSGASAGPSLLARTGTPCRPCWRGSARSRGSSRPSRRAPRPSLCR